MSFFRAGITMSFIICVIYIMTGQRVSSVEFVE